MIIIWRGDGIKVLIVGLLGAAVLFAIPTILGLTGKTYEAVFSYCFFGAIFVTGLVCWLWGRSLNRRDRSDDGGRAPHSIYFIPIHWIGFILLTVSIGMVVTGLVYRLWHPSTTAEPAPKSRRTRNQEAAGVQAPVPRFAREAEARQHVLELYPALGVTNSPFNSEFLARHKKYQASQPEFFRDPNWPLTLANETAEALKAAGR